MENEVEEEEKIIKDQLKQLNEYKTIAPLIGSLVSLFLSLGITIQLDVIFYWLPASLALLFAWTIYSLLKAMKGRFKEEKAKQNVNLINLTLSD